MKVSQDQAFKYCDTLGGHIPILNSQGDISDIYNRMHSKMCNKGHWTDVVKSKKSQEWTRKDTDGNEVLTKSLFWGPGQPSNGTDENCIFVDQTLMYQNEICSIEFCFGCQFTEQQQVNVA